ncbi:hypothetical protein [Paraburkholderia sp. GAS348]|uniref:hypothetical protein n=1 Tax=Paraburkholderia sp. GAS348 TaxID=3035132 RepID=UPI003D1AB1AD
MEYTRALTSLSSSNTKSIAALLAMYAGIWLLDISTGYNVSVFGIYAVPVACTVWLFNARAGLFGVAIASLLWLLAYLMDGGPGGPLILFLHVINRAALLSFVVLTIVQTRRSTEAKHRAVFDFVNKLQTCRSCNHVSAGDHTWVGLDALIEEYAETGRNLKLCPECARRAYSLGSTMQPATCGQKEEC